jgi:hypothetical protein
LGFGDRTLVSFTSALFSSSSVLLWWHFQTVLLFLLFLLTDQKSPSFEIMAQKRLFYACMERDEEEEAKQIKFADVSLSTFDINQLKQSAQKLDSILLRKGMQATKNLQNYSVE